MTLAFGDDCPHRTTILKWHREFKKKNFYLEVSERIRRPRTSVTEKNITNMRKMFDEDRRVTYWKNKKSLGLNISARSSILKDRLFKTKL